jgi:hypothetical protein
MEALSNEHETYPHHRKTVIQKAKQYASAQKKSLSDIVENYLRSITNDVGTDNEFELTPIVKSLKGSFKETDQLAGNEHDYKSVLAEELSKKYLSD